MTFGNDEHALAVALLSLVVLFRLVADGQGAIIQGTRRISDLAKMGVLSGIFGTLIGIPIVYFLRADGVVPYLIGVAAMAAMFAWLYSRKIDVQPVALTASQYRQEAASLLKFGLTFMTSALLMMGAAYAVRTMVLREIGLEAAGFYQAAWTLGGLYVANILQAMGADFYPRLVAVAQDDSRGNRLVNEQEQVSLLLAGPGVIATLTLAPLIVSLFYSANFAGAVEVLRWICLGMALRVISWPMGFLVIAKGHKTVYFATELAWTVVNVGLTWICVRSFGLNGAGIAFFAAYVFHALLLYPVGQAAQRVPLDACQQEDGAFVPRPDRRRVLRISDPPRARGNRRRPGGDGTERGSLAARSAQAYGRRSGSASPAAVPFLVPLESARRRHRGRGIARPLPGWAHSRLRPPESVAKSKSGLSCFRYLA